MSLTEAEMVAVILGAVLKWNKGCPDCDYNAQIMQRILREVQP